MSPALMRAYPWLLLAPVVLPVVVVGGVVYPYLVPKTLLFWALGLLSLAAFVLLAATDAPFAWARFKNKMTWVPGALLTVAFITSAVGVDFYRSFWGRFVRGEGLLTLALAVASYYLILLLADERFFARLTRAVSAIASAVALYGIGEWLIAHSRIGSLLGNAAFFAGYLGITVFVTLLAARSLTGGWRAAAYTGAVLQVVAIVLTATRGTMLALGIALLAWLVARAWPERVSTLEDVRLGRAARSASERAFARVGLAVLLLLVVIFIGFRTQLAHIPFEPIARIATAGTGDSDIASRLFIWRNMVGQIEQHPWLGVGAEHVDVLFNNFYDPTLIQEEWFDRAHNAFLDYWAQFGIAGLALYLALITSFFVAARRLAARGQGSEATFVALLALTYAVQNFFVFDTISSFWLLVALLAALQATMLPAPYEPLALPAWARPASYVVAAILLICLYPVALRPAQAASSLVEAYRYQLTDPAREVNALSHGYALGTYGNLEYGYEAYEMYAMHQAPYLTGTALADAYQASLSVLTANFNRFPYDARTALYLAHVLSLVPQSTAIDGNLLKAALDRATTLSPNRAQPWYILANLSIGSANAYPPKSPERTAGYLAAEDILSRYINQVPRLSEPHFVLAQLLYASGDSAAAAAEAAKGKEYYRGGLETAKRAVGYYETVLDLSNAAFFLSEVLKEEPDNAAAAADLAKIKTYEQSNR